MEFPAHANVNSQAFGGAAFDAMYDMRNDLFPKRLTMAMWDQAYLLWHVPGSWFEDYDKVLDETMERGYNTVRLDPMPHLIDLHTPQNLLAWPQANLPYMPWYTNKGMEGPVGLWLIEFIEKLLERNLHYTLSRWWHSTPALGPKPEKHQKIMSMLRIYTDRCGDGRPIIVYNRFLKTGKMLNGIRH